MIFKEHTLSSTAFLLDFCPFLRIVSMTKEKDLQFHIGECEQLYKLLLYVCYGSLPSTRVKSMRKDSSYEN